MGGGGIAAWFDRLTMSGCVPGDERGGGFHPHPNPLPSRERGRAWAGGCVAGLTSWLWSAEMTIETTVQPHPKGR